MGAGIRAGFKSQAGLTAVALPMSIPVPMRLARWGVVALGIAIPLSVALDNFLLATLLVLILIGSSRTVLHTVIHNPVARANALLFAALLLGMVYGEASFKEAVVILGKYADLAFVSLLMVAGRDALTQRRVMQVFLTIMLVTAVLSWLVGLHILPVAKWMLVSCNPDNPAIFRSSITQNVLMAYAVYLLVLRARMTAVVKVRWSFIILAVFAGSSVLFMLRGKTGYLVLLALSVYFAWTTLGRRLRSHGRNFGWKEGAGIGLLGLALVVGAYQVSPRLHEQVDQAAKEFQAWQPNVQHGRSSTGERLEFYYNTFSLIKQHPLLGVGTGGFLAAYTQQVRGKDVMLTPNPHNEYLLITAQIGVVGFALLLYLFYTLWRYAAELSGTFEQDAARGLVLTIAVTALFNSPLLDHTEGLFFAFTSALLFANLGSGRRYGG